MKTYDNTNPNCAVPRVRSKETAVRETLAQVKELLQIQSWNLMDEDQRDALMQNVIVPRWGMTTADGHELKGTLWGKLTGATAKAIENRYYRLTAPGQTASDQGECNGPGALTENQKNAVRKAKQVLSDPVLSEHVVETLAADPALEAKVYKAANQKREQAHNERLSEMKKSMPESAAILRGAALTRAVYELGKARAALDHALDFFSQAGGAPANLSDIAKIRIVLDAIEALGSNHSIDAIEAFANGENNQ